MILKLDILNILNTLSESKLNEIFKDYKDDKEIIKSIELKIKESIQKLKQENEELKNKLNK